MQLDTGVPVVLGVLTTDSLEQALARAGAATTAGNKGHDAAVAAVEMADLLRQLPKAGAQGSGLTPVLRLVLPKGSLEKATLELFESADLAVSRSSAVDYRATIDDPRITDVRILRPQEIATYVAEGLFDIGITGRDWIEETGSEVVSLGQLHYSKATARPVKIVLAVAGDSPFNSVADLPPDLRVSTEYPASPASTWRRTGSASPTSGSPTAPRRPRCPTSPTRWWRSRRRAGPCGRRG